QSLVPPPRGARNSRRAFPVAFGNRSQPLDAPSYCPSLPRCTGKGVASASAGSGQISRRPACGSRSALALGVSQPVAGRPGIVAKPRAAAIRRKDCAGKKIRIHLSTASSLRHLLCTGALVPRPGNTLFVLLTPRAAPIIFYPAGGAHRDLDD